MHIIRLLYPNEHISCSNYTNEGKALIEKKYLAKQTKWEFYSSTNKIVFVLKGKLRFSFGYFYNKVTKEGQILHIPPYLHFEAYAEEDVILISIRLEKKVQSYDCHCEDANKLTKSIQLPSIQNLTLTLLEINKSLSNYIQFLDISITKGLSCNDYFEIKIRELFALLKACYSPDSLSNFFNTPTNIKEYFTEYIIQNHSKYTTLIQLAESMNYSVSGFQKKFKKSFGVSPYKWMKEQKAGRIFHEISTTNRSFKEISSDFGFSSSTSFNDFCKSYFGRTPGNIRQNKHEWRKS